MLQNIKLKYLFGVLLLIGFFIGFISLKPSNLNIKDHVINYLQDTLKDKTLAPKMVIIPTGKGTIGGEILRSFRNESPIYQVVVEKSYALSETEITFAEYDLFCQSTKRGCPRDEGWGRGTQPVIYVSWDDATAYTEWLSQQTGETYRLPSEVEWEFAARAGQNTKFWWGNEYIQGLDHCDRDYDGCIKGSELGHPWKVGILTANPFGLYDMTSNVGEWVLDCASDNHNNAANTVSPNLKGDCNNRIIKGSNWKNPQPYVHLSRRLELPKDSLWNTLGFRVLREIK